MNSIVSKDEIISYLLGKSIVVVGNARTQRKRGKEIDNFDVIIRFNEFKIEEYKDLIGTKTNIWVHNYSSTARLKEKFDYQWCPDLYRSVKDKKYYNIAPMFYPEHNINLQSANPTTGLKILTWLYDHGFQFTSYGFDGLRTYNYFFNNNDQKEKTIIANEECFECVYHDPKQELQHHKRLNRNKKAIAITDNPKLAEWAKTKFYSVLDKWPTENKNDLLVMLSGTLTDNTIRRGIAYARKLKTVIPTKNATFIPVERYK